MKKTLFILLSLPLLGSVANISSGDKKRNLEYEKARELSKTILRKQRANKKRAAEERAAEERAAEGREKLVKKSTHRPAKMQQQRGNFQAQQGIVQEQQRIIQAQQGTIENFKRSHEEQMNGLARLFQKNDNLQATIHEQQGNLQTQQGAIQELQGTVQAQQGTIVGLEGSIVESRRRVGGLTTALAGTRLQGLRDQQTIQKQWEDLEEQKRDLRHVGESTKEVVQTFDALREEATRLLENWEAAEIINQGPGTPRTPQRKQVDVCFFENAKSLLAQFVETCVFFRK